jgi:hypothetical protein
MENALELSEAHPDSSLELPFSPHLLQRLSDLGLSVRTANCMQRENIVYIGDLVQLSESQMLKFQNLGRKSLFELKDVLSGFGLRFGMEVSGWPPENIEALSKAINRGEYNLSAESAGVLIEEEVLTDEEAAAKYTQMGLLKKVELLGLSVRSANCFHNEGIIYIGDLVLRTESQLLKTPNFGRKSLNELKAALDKMELRFGMELRYWPLKNIEELASKHNDELAHENEETLKEAFSRTMEKVSDPRYLLVMEARFGLHGKPRTLEDTAQELGVTRERVRQIQKKITQTILKQEFWDDILHIRLQKLITGRSDPLFLDAIEQEDAWFAGFSDNLTLLENLLNAFSKIEDLNFLPYENRKIVTRLSYQQWRDMKYDLINMLEHSLDLGHTMDDIEMFTESKLAKAGASELSSLLFEELSKDLNFSMINGEMTLVSVGNSLGSHLRALLETTDKPMHFEEIAALYEQKYGVPISSRYVHACLGHSGFPLFGRGTYGLPRHLAIPSDVQDSMLHRIEAIILAGPADRQWHTRDLIDQFAGEPYASELDKYTVNIVLKPSKQLRYLGKWSWKIKSAGDEDAERLHMRIAIYDALKTAGGALRIEELQDLVSQARGIGDIFNVHPNELYSRVDPGTWGLLDRDFILSLPEQENLKNHLLTEFTVSGRSLHKTELLQAITGLNPPEELTDNQVLGVLIADPRFKSWHGGFVGLSSWSDSGRKSLTVVLKELAESVTDAIGTDEVVAWVRTELGHDFNRYSISIYLNKYGLLYDRDAGVWKKVS